LCEPETVTTGLVFLLTHTYFRDKRIKEKELFI
jgi:hypothetical protein